MAELSSGGVSCLEMSPREGDRLANEKKLERRDQCNMTMIYHCSSLSNCVDKAYLTYPTFFLTRLRRKKFFPHVESYNDIGMKWRDKVSFFLLLDFVFSV